MSTNKQRRNQAKQHTNQVKAEPVETTKDDLVDTTPEVEETKVEEAKVEETLTPTPIEPFAAKAKEEAPVEEEVVVVEETTEKEEAPQPVKSESAPKPETATVERTKKHYPKQLEGRLYAYYDKLTASGQSGINVIIDYAETLKPGVGITDEKGAMYQANLYRGIVAVLNEPAANFNDGLRLLLTIFKQYKKGALGPRYALRFMHEVRLSKAERDVFSTLVLTLQTLSDGASGVNVFKSIEPTLIKALVEASASTTLKPTVADNIRRFFA